MCRGSTIFANVCSLPPPLSPHYSYPPLPYVARPSGDPRESVSSASSPECRHFTFDDLSWCWVDSAALDFRYCVLVRFDTCGAVPGLVP
jgi:hypothetical protein